MKQRSTARLLLVSHLRLRRVVGSLGIALPFVLMVWGFALAGWSIDFQDSLSDYYNLRTGYAFVGILFVIAWFLFTYKGHELMDDIAGYLACAFALGVAFFPSTGESWEKIVHFSSATGLFLVLSFFSLFLFTKSTDSPKGFRRTVRAFRFGAIKSRSSRKRDKKRRNKVYVICGLVMLACLALIGLYYLLWEDTAISSINPVLWLESILIWAFGFSWLVKGETLWRDRKSIAQAR